MRGLDLAQPPGLGRYLAAVDQAAATADRLQLGIDVARGRRADVADLVGRNGHLDTYGAWTVGALDRVLAALTGDITDPALLAFVGLAPAPLPRPPLEQPDQRPDPNQMVLR